MVSDKIYFCGVCGAEESVQTNHFGEIYTECKHCNNNILSCKEAPKREHNAIATLHHYRFNLTDSETQNKKYQDLIDNLKEKGFKKHIDRAPFYMGQFSNKWNCLAEKNGQQFKIYDIDTFEDQYVSDGIRLYDWTEVQYLNKRIKEGYYLSIERL